MFSWRVRYPTSLLPPLTGEWVATSHREFPISHSAVPGVCEKGFPFAQRQWKKIMCDGRKRERERGRENRYTRQVADACQMPVPRCRVSMSVACPVAYYLRRGGCGRGLEPCPLFVLLLLPTAVSVTGANMDGVCFFRASRHLRWAVHYCCCC